MKKYLYIVCSFFCLLVVCCTKDTSRVAPEVSELSVDATNFNLSSFEETNLSISVNSNVEWTVSSSDYWIVPSSNYGKENLTIDLQVAENIYGFDRTATIKIASVDGTAASNIIINQPAQTNISTDHYYKIPVIFHVIYKNASNPQQYVKKGHLAKLLEGVNKLYKECGQNLNMEFIMATHNPQGKLLEEAGVDRVQWDIDKINHNALMGYINKDNIPERYLKLTWDPNRYVNICIYTFSVESTSGISYLPYTVAPYSLDGLEQLTKEEAAKPLKHPYCLSINNVNIYEVTDDPYSIKNIVGTIAHELGHFFGLYHTFGETENGYTRKDTDFCTDTPPYYRAAYLTEIESLLKNKTIEQLNDTEKESLLLRTDSQSTTNEKFVSDNIMDYYYTKKNAFSPEQANRIRYVLLHSPYIPGPKIME